MNSDNLLLAVAVVAVVISIAGLSMTYNSISAFESLITGHVTENGTVNITISTNTAINITSADGTGGSKIINWGSGQVNNSESAALLVTNGTILYGSWAPITEGFIVENIGNTNVTLNISSNKDAATFLGGSSGGGPLFQYNITDDATEAGSCTFNGGYSEGSFASFTTTMARICNNFTAIDSADQIKIDILLRVPSDSNTDEQTATVVLTYAEVVP